MDTLPYSPLIRVELEERFNDAKTTAAWRVAHTYGEGVEPSALDAELLREAGAAMNELHNARMVRIGLR